MRLKGYIITNIGKGKADKPKKNGLHKAYYCMLCSAYLKANKIAPD